jgi:hypothetical protein
MGFLTKRDETLASRTASSLPYHVGAMQVSSINTSFAGSNMRCSRCQRRRARAHSARLCSSAYRVFFKGNVAPAEETPNRGAASTTNS